MPPYSIKPPRSLRLLAQYGADAMKPKVIMGKYIRPLISRRIAAKLRKRAIVDGTFGSFKLLDANNNILGGWDPAWDQPKKLYFLRPFKGHIRDRTRQSR